MSIFPTKAHRFILLFFTVFITFSCSKDSDLLADYVNPGSLDGNLRRFVVDDAFLARANASIQLNVLANDTFPEDADVQITGTSSPGNGSVSINEDHSLTYSSDEPLESTDTFTYTTEVVNEDNTISSETGTVTVTITDEKLPDVIMGELKAFPGAEGFGRYATGGRGGTVVEVTNLNDDGPGSLREALKMTGSRTIIFRVGGTIECKSFLSIPANSGNVTVAGQTAPGDGIAIKGAELRIQASNVIIRYLRIRPGSSTTETNEDGIRIIAYNADLTENVILDHLSITWGKDENVEIGGIGDQSRVNNVTVQNSIIAENIRTNYGLLLWNRATNISIYKNLFAHNSERNIRSSTCSSEFEMVNNVVYGYKSGTQPTYENKFSIIGNVYKVNPNLATAGSTIKLEASLNNCPEGIITNTRCYINDNLLDSDNVSFSADLNNFLMTSPVIDSGIIPLPSYNTESEVLKSVGASLPHSDAVDLRLINDTKNKTGNLTDTETGGYPFLSVGTPFIDNDKDGISDDWEIAFGLNPANSKDGSEDANGDGYTNLEDFLHSLTL